MKKAAWMVLSMALGGCAAMKPTYQTESSFVIYDVRPGGIDRTQLLDAVQTAVQRSASKARVTRDIPPATLPETPGRFELKDPFANSNLGALMAAQGQAMLTAMGERWQRLVRSVDVLAQPEPAR